MTSEPVAVLMKPTPRLLGIAVLCWLIPTLNVLSRVATLLYPANGATGIDSTQPFTWTSVPGVQAYYLYVGTSAGGKDLVNTGEILQTSYVVRTALSINQTLYARLWTKAGGIWRYHDTTFRAAPVAH